jgi:hypothetical protein
MKCKDKKSCSCNKNHECDGKCGDRMACKKNKMNKKNKIMESEEMNVAKMPKSKMKKPAKSKK